MNTVANISVSQFLGSIVSTGGASLFGVGALKMFHSQISLTQATIPGLFSLVTETNEDKEGVKDAVKISTTLRETALKIFKQECKEIPNATARMATGFALLVLGEYLRGQSIQQIFINSLGYTPQTEQLTLSFFTAILMTTGDSIMGFAAFYIFKATIELLTTGFSGGYAPALKAAEEKEGNAPSIGGREIGDIMLNRSVRFIKNEILVISKSILAGAVGAGFLVAGARWGGTSLSSSATKFIRTFA